MNRVENLLRRYVAEHREHGDADPGRYLDELAGVDREELAALIDDYLTHVPPPAFDPDAFAAFRGEPRREAMVARVLSDEPAIADLRSAAGLTVAVVGSALAGTLELEGHETAVKGCYHEIETGNADPERVRPAIWAALAKLFGEPAERVRAAAARGFGGWAAGPAEVYARSARAPAASTPPAPARSRDPEDDRVRRAFFSERGSGLPWGT